MALPSSEEEAATLNNNNNNNNKNVQVSQSVSVSKVSVKMGGISSSSRVQQEQQQQQQQQQLRHDLLSEISDIYEDPGLSNSLADSDGGPEGRSLSGGRPPSQEKSPQPQFRRLDAGIPSPAFNSLGNEDAKLR